MRREENRMEVGNGMECIIGGVGIRKELEVVNLSARSHQNSLNCLFSDFICLFYL